MGRLLDAHNELHPENAISPGAAAATRLQLLHARRAAVAAWERQHPEAAAAQPLGKRRRADGRSGIERAVERRAGQESAPSPAERQRVEAERLRGLVARGKLRLLRSDELLALAQAELAGGKQRAA